MDAITMQLGSSPRHCAALTAGHRVCTWHVERTRHVVCELDPARRSLQCLDSPDNENVQTFPSGSPRKRKANAAKRKALIEAARAELSGAHTLWDLTRLVGAGPRECDAGERLACSWHLVRRTPGYVTLARITEAPGKKIDLECTLPDRTAPRAPASCRVGVSERGPWTDL